MSEKQAFFDVMTAASVEARDVLSGAQRERESVDGTDGKKVTRSSGRWLKKSNCSVEEGSRGLSQTLCSAMHR